MKISFYNGVSRLVAYQEDMDRISNNISNSGTVGYKASLYQLFPAALYGNGSEQRNKSADRSWRQGR